MKISKNVLAFVVLVMVTALTTTVLAQLKPTKPPSTQQVKPADGAPPPSTQQVKPADGAPPPVIRSNPANTLRDLQGAEDRNKVQREQAILAEINRLKLKKVEPPKFQLESCETPKITSVYPAEVFPRSPVLIEGCGFGHQIGEVAISSFSRPIDIDSWSDRRIQGKIHHNLDGFAEPKAVTLKVVTPTRQESNPSASITIFPDYEIKILEITPVVGQGSTPGCRSNLYTGNTFSHSSRDQRCSGVDTILQRTVLKNKWVFHHFKEIRDCRNYQTGEGNCVSGGLSGNVIHKYRPVHFNDLIGRSQLPKLEVEWGCGSRWVTSYVIELFIRGPKGTNHR